MSRQAWHDKESWWIFHLLFHLRWQRLDIGKIFLNVTLNPMTQPTLFTVGNFIHSMVGEDLQFDKIFWFFFKFYEYLNSSMISRICFWTLKGIFVFDLQTYKTVCLISNFPIFQLNDEYEIKKAYLSCFSNLVHTR